MSSETEYPSIISQPGSAGRNYSPILEALRPWVQRLVDPGSAGSSTSTSDYVSSSDSTTTSASASAPRPKIFEIGSYPYNHITGFATEFPAVEWHGSARDAHEIQGIQEALSSSQGRPANLYPPVMLDIAQEQHWTSLAQATSVRGQYDGVVMLNVIHCCPDGLPERVFQNLSPDSGSAGAVTPRDGEKRPGLLRPGGWIAVYGPFLADDGTYRSPADEEFDKTYIRAHDPRLGLRSIPSITALAAPYGFQMVEKKEMPKGNMWVVWQLRS